MSISPYLLFTHLAYFAFRAVEPSWHSHHACQQSKAVGAGEHSKLRLRAGLLGVVLLEWSPCHYYY